MKQTFNILSQMNPYRLLLGLLLMLLLTAFCSGCKSPQITQQTDNFQRVTDTIIITKTEQVRDTLRLAVPQVYSEKKACDSLINAHIHRVLSQLNTTKNSGGNAYGFYFDHAKKQLVAFANLQAQYDSLRRYQSVKILTQTREIPQRYTPLWVKILAGIGVAFLLILGVKIYQFFKI